MPRIFWWISSQKVPPRFTRTSLDSAWILDTLDTISYELVFGIVFGIFRSAQKYDMDSTAWNVCVFGVILIRIFPHSDWITPGYGHFFRQCSWYSRRYHYELVYCIWYLQKVLQNMIWRQVGSFDFNGSRKHLNLVVREAFQEHLLVWYKTW